MTNSIDIKVKAAVVSTLVALSVLATQISAFAACIDGGMI